MVELGTLGRGESVDRLGRYLLLERRPARGIVQPWWVRREAARERATDNGEGRAELLVLEHLHPDLTQHETAQGRFQRQAELALYLDHPNVVRTVARSVEDGVECVVHEPVLGSSLDRLLGVVRDRGAHLPFEVFGGIVLGVLRGLGYAHAATGPDGKPLGIVHRHLVAQSVLLGFAGDVVLGDFTAAYARVGNFRTAVGTAVGEVAYMAPEQALGQPVDVRSDVYSACALFWEMLAGRRLVSPGPLVDMLRAVIDEPAPLPLDGELGQVILRGLAKRPGDRWPDVTALELAMEAALPVAPLGRTGMASVLRTWMPMEEAATLAALERLRARGQELENASKSAPSTPIGRAPAVEPTAHVPALGPEPREPSVMTMPGAPVEGGKPVKPPPSRAPGPPPRSPRLRERAPRSRKPRPRRRPFLRAGFWVFGGLSVLALGIMSLNWRAHEEADLHPVSERAPRSPAPAVTVAPRARPTSTDRSTQPPPSVPPKPVPGPRVPSPERLPPSRTARTQSDSTRLRRGAQPKSSPPATSRSAPPATSRSAPPSAPSDPKPRSPGPRPSPSPSNGGPLDPELAAALAALDEEPGPRSFFEALRTLRTAAKSLPRSDRLRAERLLDAAERIQDTGALKRVARMLRDRSSPD